MVLINPPAPEKLQLILAWLSSWCLHDSQGFIAAEKVPKHSHLSDTLGRNLLSQHTQDWGLSRGKAWCFFQKFKNKRHLWVVGVALFKENQDFWKLLSYRKSDTWKHLLSLALWGGVQNKSQSDEYASLIFLSFNLLRTVYTFLNWHITSLIYIMYL